MPNITVVMEGDYRKRATIRVEPGTSICDALLDHNIDIEHACGKVGACTTCHAIIREGYSSLSPPSEQEEDMLDRAWGVEQWSRLSCQAIVTDMDLVVEIPKYSVNHAKERD